MGWLVSDLPFATENDGYQLHRMLGRIFEAPDEHDHTRTIMLHLFSQNRPILLEMVAAHVFVTESESAIILSGRVVDSELAGLMANGAVSLSESNCDVNEKEKAALFREIRSISQAGSIKGDDDDRPLPATTNHSKPSSIMSSLTAPSSIISSLTAPSVGNPSSKVTGATSIRSLAMPISHPPSKARDPSTGRSAVDAVVSAFAAMGDVDTYVVRAAASKAVRFVYAAQGSALGSASASSSSSSSAAAARRAGRHHRETARNAAACALAPDKAAVSATAEREHVLEMAERDFISAMKRPGAHGSNRAAACLLGSDNGDDVSALTLPSLGTSV